jgi:hypothetical protein
MVFALAPSYGWTCAWASIQIERNLGNVTPTRLEFVNLSDKLSEPPFIS